MQIHSVTNVAKLVKSLQCFVFCSQFTMDMHDCIVLYSLIVNFSVFLV